MSHRTFCDTFLAALSRGDFAALEPMLDPEFFLEEAQGLPYGGTYRGVDGWRGLSKAIASTWSNFRLLPLEFPGETADTFTVRFAISGKSRLTGKKFESTVLELWRFRGQRLLQIVPYYWDTHLLALCNTT